MRDRVRRKTKRQRGDEGENNNIRYEAEQVLQAVLGCRKPGLEIKLTCPQSSGGRNFISCLVSRILLIKHLCLTTVSSPANFLISLCQVTHSENVCSLHPREYFSIFQTSRKLFE